MRLAIFDVDGTISDSQAHILHAMRFAFAQEAVAAPDRAAILSIVGLSLPPSGCAAGAGSGPYASDGHRCRL